MAADAAQADNEVLAQKVRQFTEFLDSDQTVYEDKIRAMMAKGDTRLLVDVADLREADSKLWQKVMDSPGEYLPAFDKALSDVIHSINPDYGKENKAQFSIGFEGNMGSNHVTPRNLNAVLLNKLVAVDGIVTKCSLVRPKVLKSVHYCEVTKTIHQREFRDSTSFSGLPTSTSAYMTRDDDGNLLSTEYGLCEYTDSQGIHLQEMPEFTDVGSLPRSVDVLITNDLVDTVKPGDRVRVVGVYKPLSGRGEGQTGVFKTAIIGVAIKTLAKESLQSGITDRDIKNIRAIATKSDCFDSIASSLAPSICGHDFVKKGLLLQLLGGTEKNLANGTHIRGDINMLMVGDPSVAKSQLLRYVLNTAPLAVSTTGRGSSGVGLTAAVTQDSETGERKLEAGAMVLADRGMVCIDEFDKMSDQDRVAIHEVMEQQTVTIAKAGIHTSLNARCSVVAAANPVYGSYNRQKKTTENIGLPDSLLSRFDLLFILLDTVEESHDKRISDHVLRQHRYRGPTSEEAGPLTMGDDQDDVQQEDETPMYEKFNQNLHRSREDSQKIYTQSFIKKFVKFAQRTKPRLDEESSTLIAQYYTTLRESNDIAGGALPITPRTLETLIRLSTAHAKCRLSALVERKDVEEAYKVLMFALTNEVPDLKGGDLSDIDEADQDSDDDNDGDEAAKKSQKKATKKRRTRTRRAAGSDDDNEDDDGDDHDDSDYDGSEVDGAVSKQTKKAVAEESASKRRKPAEKEQEEGASKRTKTSDDTPIDITSARYQNFIKSVNKQMTESVDSVSRDAFDNFIRKDTKTNYGTAEITKFLKFMTENNEIYYVEDGAGKGEVYRV